jgi:hypothetical protein
VVLENVAVRVSFHAHSVGRPGFVRLYGTVARAEVGALVGAPSSFAEETVNPTHPARASSHAPVVFVAVLVPLAVGTGSVVIVVAVAVVLIVLIVAVSMRGRQKRAAERRAEDRSAPSAGPVPDDPEHGDQGAEDH